MFSEVDYTITVGYASQIYNILDIQQYSLFHSSASAKLDPNWFSQVD